MYNQILLMSVLVVHQHVYSIKIMQKRTNKSTATTSKLITD